MNTLRYCALGFLLLVAVACLGADAPATDDASARGGAMPANHTRYVVGLSPFLEDSSKDETFRGLVHLLLEEMPLNSSLWVYDAFRLRSITHVEIPAVRAFESGKTRANQFKAPILDLRKFLSSSHTQPASAGFNFDQAVRLPQFLDFISDNLTGSNQSVIIVVLGSPLYRDDKEPGFAMVDGYFPSDGHLMASRERSVFGVKDRADSLKNVTVHWGYFGDPWASELHQEKVSRFWTLFLRGQGARLATFSGDVPTVFNSLRRGVVLADARERRHEIDPKQSKVEMLRVGREVGVSDWITRELPAGRPAPPTSSVGPMKIGIRWKGEIDLDLYARAKRGGETLYFEHLRTAEGYYYKDHRSSPDREYEFIEFTEPVELWQVEASVNFYRGRDADGPEGEVRVEFNGRIYSGQFTIAANRGNEGRGGSGQDRFWATLDIPKLVGLR